MPRRKLPLITNETYHVFNRSVANEKFFSDDLACKHFIELINYYRFADNPLRYSYFKKLNQNSQREYLKSLYDSDSKIELISFCIMPNHYHFLLKQTADSGIQNFIRLLQNGYAKYYNIRFERHGAVFQTSFKAVRIESEEQLVHTSRYIHLNPVSANILNINKLRNHTLTSFTDYLSDKPRNFITSNINNYFKSVKNHKNFVFNRSDYQKNLQKIKFNLNHTSGV